MDLPINQFKRRLLAGRVQTGLWVTIPDPSVVEAMAGAGFDWITLDTEHAAVEVSAIMPLLQAAAAYPSECIVRPSDNDTALIKRHLDQGVQTIVIPNVQTKAEAEAAVAAMFYPPRGIRGVAGLTRAAGFGRIANYTARANDEICLIVQVESAEAMDRLEEIAGVEGVDAIFIGPADLAASMGYPGQIDHPDVRAAILDAIARLKAMGVASGLLTLDAEFARLTIDAGASIVAVGIDMALLIDRADTLSSEFAARPTPGPKSG